MADVTLPQLGETVTEGTITKWFKKVGDNVTADEPLFEVSTDKVDTEVPSPVAGTLSEIKAQEGDTVPVGAVIAVVGDAGAAPAPAPEEPAASEEPAAARNPPPARHPPPPSRRPRPLRPSPLRRRPLHPRPLRRRHRRPRRARSPSPPRSGPRRRSRRPSPGGSGHRRHRPRASGDNRLLSPVVRRLVAEHDLDPAQITGTGPGGRITRDDVLDHIDRRATGAPAAAPASLPRPRHRQPHRLRHLRRPRPPRRRPDRPHRPHLRRRRVPSLPSRRPGPASATRSVALSKIRKLTGDHMIMRKRSTPARLQRRRGRLRQRRRRPHGDQGPSGRRARASASPTCRSSAGP